MLTRKPIEKNILREWFNSGELERFQKEVFSVISNILHKKWQDYLFAMLNRKGEDVRN